MTLLDLLGLQIVALVCCGAAFGSIATATVMSWRYRRRQP